jgi:3-hydroxyisobutyrate dehydrogenase-like beta-hydroxyacid dehydrogenase
LSRTIGLIGIGEAGLAVAAGLVDAAQVRVLGHDVRLADPASSDGLREAAARAGIELVPGPAEVAASSSVVFSFVTARSAETVARATAPHLTPGHLYVDANSAAPDLMLRVARVIEASGARFADAAVMAAVPPHGHRVPILASGGGAPDLVDFAAAVGMQVEVVDGEAGAASCVKMLRSLLVKGVEALILQTGLAAHQFGVFDRVLDSMADLAFENWRALADYLLSRTALHGQRRGHELEEVAATLAGLSLDPGLAEAGARALLAVSADGRLRQSLDGHAGPDRHDVVQAALRKVQEC